ncbi:F-box/kelch-repeat protein At3g23880-like [Eucalyptus grandis]|uniref:F-box/kelch-repeat protein At3g23880-like n=1 Tax=Eucalyptus grandis TaxID=71139 RepID=UPI00192EC808|nr:F-box/kelch-repeat protein At3g23880-like [Eucalyptus grandis]
MSSSAGGGGGGDPKLPHDVIIEILKRLPARSLLRFRSVCRLWRSTIDDLAFVALHSRYSALDASSRYVVCIDWGGPDERRCSLFRSESFALQSPSQIEIPFVNPVNGYALVGSCNGLICFTELSKHSRDETMYVWNLFTRRYKAVILSHPGLFSAATTPEALGFGFDAWSGDYKIVRIRYRHDTYLVEIYSLRMDSWRSLECQVPAFCAFRPSVFLNGNLHWHLFEHDDPRKERKEGGWDSILLFDLAGEMFHEMALPEEMIHQDNGYLLAHLSVLDDFLAMFIHVTDRVHSCSVWVMREYCSPDSWTELYSVKSPGLVTNFYGFMSNGNVLMEMDDKRVCWDPKTGQYVNLPLSANLNLVTVGESLLSF